MKQERPIVLIPSLEPDERLPHYVDSLFDHGVSRVVIVNDGSSAKYDAIFDALAKRNNVTVLKHDVNRGKGAALKTGYRYIFDHYTPCVGVITADADGQHTAEDVVKLQNRLMAGETGLILGSRDFSQHDVPFKSRWGNRITTFVFFLSSGKWVTDTQTGLRAFPSSLLPFMMDISGERFEYEMNVLIACARDGVAMTPETIRTVYENDNKGSHFNPIKDSWRIYKLILKGLVRFLVSSLLATALDFLVCFLLFDLFRSFAWADGPREAAAMVIARICSATFNFFLNRSFVFNLKKSGDHALAKYFALCVGVLVSQWLMLQLLHGAVGIGEKVATAIGNILIFFPNYQIQQRWIFHKTKETVK